MLAGRIDISAAIIVKRLDEPPSCLQHGFGYQVQAREHPHHYRQHGQASIRWPATTEMP
jgi:hypothetical protein